MRMGTVGPYRNCVKKKKQSATFHSLACAGILAPPVPNVRHGSVHGEGGVMDGKETFVNTFPFLNDGDKQQHTQNNPGIPYFHFRCRYFKLQYQPIPKAI